MARFVVSTTLPLSERDRPLLGTLNNASLAALVLLAHGLLWTLLPWLINRSLPLDTLEALAWGREWQWGYYKHPPLSGWLAELMRFGPHDLSLYVLSQLMVGLALWANWLLGRDLLGSRLATVGLMAMAGIHYVGYSSVEFNANVVMFPMWAWGTWCGWRALRHGGIGWWLGLGVCSGLGALGKYVFLLLPASLFLYAVIQPQARQHWRTPGPWLALLAFAALFGPHVHWAMVRDWPTLHYAFSRGQSDELAKAGTWSQEFLSFVFTQLMTLLPAWLLLRSMGDSPKAQRTPAERWLLLTLAMGPALLIMSAAVAAQAKMLHMWASPFFLCVTPLWLAWRTPTGLNLGRFVKVWVAFALLFPALFIGVSLWGPQHKHKLDRTGYPSAEIAQALSTQWRAQTGQALTIVGGEGFVAEAIAHYSPDRPSVFFDTDFGESLWMTPAEVHQQGALLVWPLGRGEVPEGQLPTDSREQVVPLLSRYPTLAAQPTLKVHTTWMGKPYTVAVAWAVLPPAGVAPRLAH